MATTPKAVNRDIGRKAKTTRVNPDDVLIAGEDFHGGCQDFDFLCDAQSAEREGIDEAYIANIVKFGAQNPVRVVMRKIDGREGRHPVVVHGRRTVRHVREVCERYPKLSPQIELRFIPAAATGITLWQIARIENHPGLPETNAQRVEYVATALAHQRSDDDICELLRITPAQLRALTKLGDLGVIPSVRERLDDGTMPVSAALALAVHPPPVQQATIATILSAGKAFTVNNIRRALAGQGAIVAKFAPPPKVIRRILKDPDLCERFNKLAMQPVDVLRFMRGDLDMDDFPELANLLQEAS